MRCSKVKKMLGAYLDGELSDRKASKVKRHLTECSSCTWELESFRKVDEFSQWAVDTEAIQKHQSPLEDYMADLRVKLEKAKSNQGSRFAYLYSKFRYTISDFVTYWLWRLAPGVAFALIIAGLYLGISYIRNESIEIPQETSPVVAINDSKQETIIPDTSANSENQQKESESQKIIFNFYLKEHQNAVMQQLAYADQLSQKSIELDDSDVLHYDTMREANSEWQREAGVILRASRRPNVAGKAKSPQAKQIINGHNLSLEQAIDAVTFKVVAPQTLYPGYLLESIRKIEEKNCLHLIYTNGINTLSIFEQSMTDDKKLRSSDFKEYVMYSKEGNEPANIIGWNSGGVSFTIIGNEDFGQLINITREIQKSSLTDGK